MDLKTPGVFIVEKNAFPNSAVEVASAVPAFVGHTAIASNNGASLRGKPWRISSMAEYALCFGGLPQARLRIDAVAAGDTEPVADMEQARAQTRDFTLEGRRYRLTRGAGRAGGRHLLPLAMRHFFQNGGAACYVVSVGGFDDEIAAGDEASGLIGGIAALRKEQEPTILVVPDAVLLPRAGCTAVHAAMLAHCGRDMGHRFAILDVWGGDRAPDDAAGNCIDHFRADLAPDHRDHAAAYFPWLHTTLVQANELDQDLFDPRDTLAALLKEQLKLPAAATAGLDDRARQLIALFDDLGRSDDALADKLKRAIEAGLDPAAPGPLLVLAPPKDRARLKAYFADYKRGVHQAALATSPLYTLAVEEARTLLNVMPPSAAMAGVYTRADDALGVWKAPANVSLNGVVAPTTALSNAAQEALNVTPQGASINAIRSFPGKGVLVWGARTLDGNSADWRYISVRRTALMVEESCRLALKAYVFEANDANTWTTVRSMLNNYLTSLWKRGGLMGATPDDAFAVQCGLGQTMTAQDLLEGRLRVVVLLAFARPAEFIVISFEQQQAAAP